MKSLSYSLLSLSLVLSLKPFTPAWCVVTTAFALAIIVIGVEVYETTKSNMAVRPRPTEGLLGDGI